MIRAILMGAALSHAFGSVAAAQEAGEAADVVAPPSAPAISILIESADPAIDPSALRAALSEALGRPVGAVVGDPLLTLVGTVGPEGAASVQIIGARTRTYTVPRGEPGWLLRWLREELERRMDPPIIQIGRPPVFAGVENADGLSPPIAPSPIVLSPTAASPIAPPPIEDEREAEVGVEVADPTRALGWLNLLSVPPATVSVGGRRIGTTPLVGREMSPGTHQLLLTTGRGVSQVIDVTIEAGRRTTRSLSIH